MKLSKKYRHAQIVPEPALIYHDLPLNCIGCNVNIVFVFLYELFNKLY